ncbi:SufE family protein [Chlamydiales bacterium]|nr:SufE family protein [Chlamydiales bacterium]
MYNSCLRKQEKIKELFALCKTQEDVYKKIIELGQQLGSLSSDLKTEDRRVHGCQSLMYLNTKNENNLLIFEADSDALISKGLAFLLVSVYSGETADAILKCPPTFLETLKITSSLTPNRANGLYSMHLKMQQEALKFLVSKK